MKILTFMLSLLFCIQTFAGEQLFLQANSEYANENYTVAISLYDSILTKGMESSELYYSLGNCYYKTQDWANAIWYYEKSLQLEKKENTIHNLELTKLKITDRIEPLPQLFYKKWGNNLTQLLSTKTWQTLAILCIWIVVLLRLLNQFTSVKNKLFLRILYLTVVILLFITHNSYMHNFIKKEGVIFSSIVIVNSAPTANSTDLFSLHSGAKVEIVDEIGEWINIKIANGKRGWIKQNSCKNL